MSLAEITIIANRCLIDFNCIQQYCVSCCLSKAMTYVSNTIRTYALEVSTRCYGYPRLNLSYLIALACNAVDFYYSVLMDFNYWILVGKF